MILKTLTFDSEINSSLQVGDKVYYSSIDPPAGGSQFQAIGSNQYANIVEFGIVTQLIPHGNPQASPPVPANSIVVVYDDVSGVAPPALNDYIMFAKDKEVNSSSLIGYYAEVTFKNNASNGKIDLFSIGSEVSESSK